MAVRRFSRFAISSVPVAVAVPVSGTVTVAVAVVVDVAPSSVFCVGMRAC